MVRCFAATTLVAMLGCKKDPAPTSGSEAPASKAASAASVDPAAIPATVTTEWCKQLRERLRSRFTTEANAKFPGRDANYVAGVVGDGVRNVEAKCQGAVGQPTPGRWQCYWSSSIDNYQDCDQAKAKAAGAPASFGFDQTELVKRWSVVAGRGGTWAKIALKDPKTEDLPGGKKATYALPDDVSVVVLTNADGSVRRVTITSPVSGAEFYEPNSTTFNTRYCAFRALATATNPDGRPRFFKDLEEDLKIDETKDVPSVTAKRLSFTYERRQDATTRFFVVKDASDTEP